MASPALVLKQGYLYRKRERTTTSVLKKPWQYGYYVLKELPLIEGLQLEEYKDASLKTLRNEDVLGGIKHIGQVRTSKSKQFAFEVVTVGKRAFMLACDNESLMNEWMRTFSNFMWSTRSSPEGSPGLHDLRINSDASGIINENGKNGDDWPLGLTPGGRSSPFRVFQVKIQRTPLSVAKNLHGSYLMQIMRTRVILKTIDGKEDVLRWPLDQLRGFKSHPEMQQVVFEIGRRCYFGEGQLKFQTPRCEEIVEIIRRTPVPGHFTVENRKDSYKVNMQRQSSGSSFESDVDKRKESVQSEDSMCTVHVSGPARQNIEKFINHSIPGSAVQKQHPKLRKQQEVDSNIEDTNEVFESLPGDQSDDMTTNLSNKTDQFESRKTSEASDCSSSGARGNELGHSNETTKNTSIHLGNEVKIIKSNYEDLEKPPTVQHLQQVSDTMRSVDQDDDSQSYVELLEDKEGEVKDTINFNVDDDEKLLSMVVDHLTNPLKPKTKMLTIKSASTGGMESGKPYDEEQGRRASAPNVIGPNRYFEDSEAISGGGIILEEKHAKHISHVAKRITKLEDIEEVVSIDVESVVNENKDLPDGNDSKPRSLTDVRTNSQSASSTQSATYDLANHRGGESSEEAGPQGNEQDRNNTRDRASTVPISPFKQHRENNLLGCEVRINGHPLARNPISQLVLFPSSKTPSFPKTQFRQTLSLGPDMPLKGYFSSLSREIPHSLEQDIQVHDACSVENGKPPQLPPKAKQNSPVLNEPPNIPKRAPFHEKSLSGDSTSPQQDGRPYINSPPPLTPRQADALPLTPIQHSKSSDSIVPPPRPPKPSGFAPLESTRSLPPFATGVELPRRGQDTGRSFSPIAFDTTFSFGAILGKTRTSPDGEHHLGSPGPIVKWKVPNITPPRSPHQVRLDRKGLSKGFSFSDSNISSIIKRGNSERSVKIKTDFLDINTAGEGRQVRSSSLVIRKITSATAFLKKGTRSGSLQLSSKGDVNTEKRANRGYSSAKFLRT